MTTFLHILFFVVTFGFVVPVNADTYITGRVIGAEEDTTKPLNGASVQWLDGGEGTYTDEQGRFQLSFSGRESDIVITYVGFTSDTIRNVSSGQHIDIQLYSSSLELLSFELLEDRKSKPPSFEVAVVDNVSADDLQRSSCCDLSGCFENTPSVGLDESDPVMGRKEIALLGLEGVHTEVMLDGQPGMVWGLSRGYGLNALPGSFISDIFITKGPNSVLQTNEGAGGMVDVRLKDPGDTTQLHLNTYINHHGENQHNSYFNYGSGKWKGTGAVHYGNQPLKKDINNDGYIDAPLYNRAMAIHKGAYEAETLPLQIESGVRLALENRLGGHTDYDKNQRSSQPEIFGREQNMGQVEIWKRGTYELSSKDALQLSINSGKAVHSGYFAPLTSFDASQYHLQNHIQYNRNWRSHNFRGGLAWQYRQMTASAMHTETENNRFSTTQRSSVPGVFAENSFYFYDDKLVLMPGFRYDKHNKFGDLYTPRLLARMDIGNWTLQAMGGLAHREPYAFAEFGHLYSSSRQVTMDENPPMEKSQDIGFTVKHTFEKEQEPLFEWQIEAHRTYFENQLRASYQNIGEPSVHVTSYDFPSINNHLQVHGTWHFSPTAFFTAAYIYHDNFAKDKDEQTILRDHGLNQHKVLLTGSYSFLDDTWQADANVHFYGDHIQPDLDGIPEEISDPLRVDDYYILNIQLRRRFQNFSIYAGAENLNDFRIPQTVLNATYTQGSEEITLFDPNQSRGPSLGRTIYLGLNIDW